MRYGLGRATRISTEPPLSTALLFRVMECHAPPPNLCFGKSAILPRNYSLWDQVFAPSISHHAILYLSILKQLFLHHLLPWIKHHRAGNAPGPFSIDLVGFLPLLPLFSGVWFLPATCFSSLQSMCPVEQRVVEQHYFTKTPAMTLRLTEHLESTII